MLKRSRRETVSLRLCVMASGPRLQVGGTPASMYSLTSRLSRSAEVLQLQTTSSFACAAVDWQEDHIVVLQCAYD